MESPTLVYEQQFTTLLQRNFNLVNRNDKAFKHVYYFVFITILCNGNTSVDLYYQQIDVTSPEHIKCEFDIFTMSILLFFLKDVKTHSN